LNGPWWHISSNHTLAGEPCKQGRQAIAAVHGESKRGAKAYAEMFEANAHLIAAAPSMLAELHKARAALKEHLDELIESHTNPDTGLITDDADMLAIESDQDLINGIDRVIAQAEGHAPG